MRVCHSTCRTTVSDGVLIRLEVQTQAVVTPQVGVLYTLRNFAMSWYRSQYCSQVTMD